MNTANAITDGNGIRRFNVGEKFTIGKEVDPIGKPCEVEFNLVKFDRFKEYPESDKKQVILKLAMADLLKSLKIEEGVMVDLLFDTPDISMVQGRRWKPANWMAMQLHNTTVRVIMNMQTNAIYYSRYNHDENKCQVYRSKALFIKEVSSCVS